MFRFYDYYRYFFFGHKHTNISKYILIYLHSILLVFDIVKLINLNLYNFCIIFKKKIKILK